VDGSFTHELFQYKRIACTKFGHNISLRGLEFRSRRTHTDCNCTIMGIRSRAIIICLQRWRNILKKIQGGPPYPRVIRSKTYRGYVIPRIMPNAIY